MVEITKTAISYSEKAPSKSFERAFLIISFLFQQVHLRTYRLTL